MRLLYTFFLCHTCMLLVILYILIYICLNYTIIPQYKDSLRDEEFPKHIWIFWHSRIGPKIVGHCIRKLKQMNPSWSIIVLNDKTYTKYIEKIEQRMPLQQKSEFIRVNLLEKYGGIWCDASILFLKPIEDIFIDYHKYEYIGYRNPVREVKELNKPVIESWFMGCKKECLFIKKLRIEMNTMFEYTHIIDYVDNLLDKGVSPQKIRHIDYLAMYIAIQYVLDDVSNYLLLDGSGPLFYEQVARSFKGLKYNTQPVIKLTKEFRGAKHFHKHLYNL